MNSTLPLQKRLEKARTSLLLDQSFFGSLLFRLKVQERRSVKTMATDGISLFYNPDFVETLSAATLVGVLAHECMHPALNHHTRRSGRALRRWNEACDYAINPMILEAGLMLPDGVLVDKQYSGLSAEEIYNLLGGDRQAVEKPSPEQDGSDDDPSSCEHHEPAAPESRGGIGQVLDAPAEDETTPGLREQEREWAVAVQQAAAVAARAGNLPAGVTRTLQGAAEAQLNWRELLRRFWSDSVPADYDWARPNRRHIWNGIYLPGTRKDGTGVVAIAVDCSGSVNERQLGLFEAEIRSILEGNRPERVHVLYFDSCVQRVESFGPGDPIRLKPVGGGGTKFGPCFEWLAARQIHPQTLVFLTDLYGEFPQEAPNYPVVWASTGAGKAAFGQVVPMQAA